MATRVWGDIAIAFLNKGWRDTSVAVNVIWLPMEDQDRLAICRTIS